MDVEMESHRFQRSMFLVCNVAMPRVKSIMHNAVYWWTPERSPDCAMRGGERALQSLQEETETD